MSKAGKASPAIQRMVGFPSLPSLPGRIQSAHLLVCRENSLSLCAAAGSLARLEYGENLGFLGRTMA
jgi:hypothetical protein